MNPRLKSQHYCGSPSCQRARKNSWEKKKRIADPTYGEQRKASRKKWYVKCPGDRYQKEYREKHPSYVLANVENQRLRNARRVGTCSPDEKIVKTDALSSPSGFVSGFYRLFPVVEPVDESGVGKIVKTDALVVEIRLASGFGEILHERSP
jgi:hypothetical protein